MEQVFDRPGQDLCLAVKRNYSFTDSHRKSLAAPNNFLIDQLTVEWARSW